MDKKELAGSVTRQVTVYAGGTFRREERELVEEVNWRVTVDGQPAGHIACSPWGIRQAVLGALYTQGRISGAADVRQLEICEDTGEIRIFVQAKTESPPAVAGGDSEQQLSAEEVCRLAATLEERSRLFQRTGGVHCAALSGGGEFLAYAEDVSRHAAVDKLVGSCLERGIPMAGGVLVFSGRVPGEILRKAAAMGCTVVISRSAPTDHACALAEEMGITLICFARGDAFNVYSRSDRVACAL